MRNLLSLTRPKNLLIVAVSQIILIYFVIHPFLEKYQVEPILNTGIAALFIICTVLISAAGYVINDILDYNADQINKLDKVFLGQTLNRKHAVLFYALILILGFLSAIIIAFKIQRLDLLWIYPMANILLFLYSYIFKNLVLIGNIIVALFTAGVCYILLFAEQDSILNLSQINKEKSEYLEYLILSFCGFSFLANLAREIIKDIEDLEGDKLVHSKTLPIVFGVTAGKYITVLISILLILGYIFFIVYHPFQLSMINNVVISLITIFTCYLIYQVYRSNEKVHFSRVSILYKILMLSGLILLISISQS